jgi:hypothetical protein
MQSCENLATKRPESPAQHTYLFVSDADPRLSNMISRTGNDFTYRFPFIALAVAELPARPCVINGEAIVGDESGLVVFELTCPSAQSGCASSGQRR